MGGESNAPGMAEAARMLAWWLDAGVDTPIQEQPRNWLKPRKAAAVDELSADTPAPAFPAIVAQ